MRVDVEMSGIFEGPAGEGAEPDWEGLDEVLERAREHDLRVLGMLLGTRLHLHLPRALAGRRPLPRGRRRTSARLAGEIAEHAKDTIEHWEIVNEPDGDWAFEGTPEQYAAMLSAAYDEIKARVPDAHDRVRRRYAAARAGLGRARVRHARRRRAPQVRHRQRAPARAGRTPWCAATASSGRGWPRAGSTGRCGSPSTATRPTPPSRCDPAYTGGDAAQAGYLTQTLVGLGEAGAEQVFVTLRDNLDGEYASEGLVHIDGAPEGDTTRRPAFAAVRRLVTDWDQLMAWRGEQRENERLVQLYQAVGLGRGGPGEDRAGQVPAGADAGARRPGRLRATHRARARVRKRLLRRLARARALVAGRRTVLLWHSAYSRWQRSRAAERQLRPTR